MAKNDKPVTQIVWKLINDGLQPTPAPWGYIVRNPLVRAIPAGKKMRIDLQVMANYPMLAFPSRTHADDLTVQTIIQVGQSVVVELENKSQHMPMIVEEHEALVNLHPLIDPGTVGVLE